MNPLVKIKLANQYDLTVNSLYKQIEDEEGQLIDVPITDVEGTTALLITDGTSWEFTDDEWQQIDQSIDFTINNSLLPFLMSLCNSIHNGFTGHCCIKEHDTTILEYVVNEGVVDTTKIKILTENKSIFKVDDFIRIKTCTNEYLTRVLTVTDDYIIVDNSGLNIRVTGEEEWVCRVLVSFPADFLDSAYAMLAYDLFARDSKEKRQERLGNYTYTNFEPIQYYGEGSYPKYLEDAIKYWQRVYI